VDAPYMDMKRHMCFVYFLCPCYLICWANPSLNDTTMNHLTKIQGKVDPIYLNFKNFNSDFYYWFAPHGLCAPHLCIHYGKFINTYIGYTTNIFVFLKCSKYLFLKFLIPYHWMSSCTIIRKQCWFIKCSH
jgi:hypothetical protein